MTGTLRAISAEDFDRWQPALKVIAHDHARRFAAIAMAGGKPDAAISWRGETIEPVLRAGSQSELWIGIDQRVACISVDGRTVVSIGLASSLLNIQCFRHCVAVLCEAEVILFNPDYSIRAIRAVPEVPSDIAERDGNIVVTLDDGTEQVVG